MDDLDYFTPQELDHYVTEVKEVLDRIEGIWSRLLLSPVRVLPHRAPTLQERLQRFFLGRPVVDTLHGVRFGNRGFEAALVTENDRITIAIPSTVQEGSYHPVSAGSYVRNYLALNNHRPQRTRFTGQFTQAMWHLEQVLPYHMRQVANPYEGEADAVSIAL